MVDKELFYPMLFEPVLKDYVWGGRGFESLLGRSLPPGIVAESWEIAAHPDGTSRVINGRYAGLLLTEAHAQLGLDLIGTASAWAQERGKFPLLIKLLDAHDKLSVQVHPDDDYALAHEGNELGKTEMWVVLRATPEAAIILGIAPGTTRERFEAAIRDGTLERYLHRIPLTQGDIICVPAGSIHAILGGALIAEIQQNSNTTYRVYDWNRHLEGKPRPLHIRQAMDVINFDQVAPGLPQPTVVAQSDGTTRYQLCANRYFVTERVELAPGAVFDGCCDGRSLEIWGAIEGDVDVGDIRLAAVQFTLLPAVLGDFRVRAGPRGATCLRTFVA
jgi:mannose-6-phosphate isomerase